MYWELVITGIQASKPRLSRPIGLDRVIIRLVSTMEPSGMIMEIML